MPPSQRESSYVLSLARINQGSFLFNLQEELSLIHRDPFIRNSDFFPSWSRVLTPSVFVPMSSGLRCKKKGKPADFE